MRQQYIEEIPIPNITMSNESDLFKAFSFTTDEIEFIYKYVEKRKKEILDS